MDLSFHDNQKINSLSLKKSENEILSRFDKWIVDSKTKNLSEINNFLYARSNLIDKALAETWQNLGLSNYKEIALFAVGGYGRKELFPHSDIDLLLLSKETPDNSQKKLIELFVSSLWDLGLEIGHSVRNIKESKYFAKEDIRNMTNLLESRFLAGDKEMDKSLNKIINQRGLWGGHTFFKTKLKEQEERHNNFNNTEYNLEPDIKSSPGGLRDIHIIDWLLFNYSRTPLTSNIKLKKILTKQEKEELTKNKYWLSTIRYFLHRQAKREEDRLLFEFQLNIARILFPQVKEINSAAERLMHRYYRAALNISEINSTVIQSFKEQTNITQRQSKTYTLNKNFFVKNKLIELRKGQSFKKNPSLMLAIFVMLCQNPNLKGISSDTLRKLKKHRKLITVDFRKKKKNIDLFMELIKSKRLMVTQLERMKQLGVLGRYLPEFGRVTGQMQYDLFHIYTVDAHSLQVLRNMRRLFLGTSKALFPLASEIIKNLPKLELLYIAGLYHDIGKGRGRDHSALGARTVRRFCKLHRFNEEDTALIEWLVINHLKMSITSQKEDLGDIEVIKNFSDLVSDPVKLDYLYCLTVADISATNPTLWNTWNSSLLRELYFKTMGVLKKDDDFIEKKSRSLVKREAIKTLNKKFHFHEKEINNLWQNFYPGYFDTFSAEELALHTYLILSNEKNATTVEVIHQADSSSSELLIFTKDRPNVFATIINKIDKENINILDARLFGTKDGNCLDLIKISDLEGNFLHESHEVLEKITSSLSKELSKQDLKPRFVKKRISKKFQNFQRETNIKIKHDMKNRWTQIDLETADRPGLLYAVSKVFKDHNASIKKARIRTYGERAEDRFCITSTEETPFLKRKELDHLIHSLKTSLDG